jgi:hypothetical protein
LRKYDADDDERFAKALGIREWHLTSTDRKSGLHDLKAQLPAANDLSFQVGFIRALIVRLCTLRTWLFLLAVALSASVAIRVTAQTHAPTVVATAPAARPSDLDRFKRIIAEQFPQLLTQKIVGTAVLTVLFDGQGQVAGTRLDISSATPETLVASVFQFASFDVSPGELRDIGSTRLDLPLNHVLVVFARKN